ncbi:hypothetical protein [Archangium lipolyticum]|uniref:hypothetical protein n=1 Tax=Archangium lipolyticum TaxID=2970465 RepID=UPI002149BAE0|nr:hypothetical protein [Archangium lipolyticum]
MKSMKVLAWLACGLGAVACGGSERDAESSSLSRPKPDAREAVRAGKLVVNPQLQQVPARDKSALAFDIQAFGFVFVCERVDGQDYCEDVRDYPDTYYNWNGTVGVWTYEYGTASTYFSTFANSAVYQDETKPLYDTNNMMVGLWRHYTLQNVTSGSFVSQVTSAFNNQNWSDTLYIY